MGRCVKIFATLLGFAGVAHAAPPVPLKDIPANPAVAQAARIATLGDGDVIAGDAFTLSDRFEREEFGYSAQASGAAFTVAASGAQTGLPVDLAVTQTASAIDDGAFGVTATGAEVRLGQRLRSAIGKLEPGEAPSWYVFAGGGGQAITYAPGLAGVSDGGAVRLQDRVRVGRMQAGVAMEHKGVQASLAYVRKDVTYSTEDRSRQQHFAGLTVSFKH